MVRDAAVILPSLVIIASQYGKLAEEPVFLITVSMSAVLLALSAVDVTLVVLKRGRGAMVGITTFQMIPGILWALLYLPIGLIILATNVIVLVALREKKSPEELLRHPPPPRTRNYKLVVGVGTLVMVAALLLPWISTADGTFSLVGLYGGIAARTNLPGVTISPVGVVFAVLTLFLSPLAPAFGVLALRWRRLAGVSGVFGLLGGMGIVAAATSVATVGAYVFAAGGILLLVAHFGFRKRS